MSAFNAARWAEALINLTGDHADEALVVLEQVAAGVRAAPAISSHFSGAACARRIENALKPFKAKSRASLNAHHFVILMTRSGHLFQIDEFIESVKEAIKVHKGIMQVKVETVFPLDEKERKNIKEILKKKYKAKDIELDEKTNPSLLGGMRIQVGSERFDGSLSGSLAALSSTLGAAKRGTYK